MKSPYITPLEASRIYNIPLEYVYIDIYKNPNSNYVYAQNNSGNKGITYLIKRSEYEKVVQSFDYDRAKYNTQDPFYILECFNQIDSSSKTIVYFISDGEYVKIGYTSDIKERIQALQIGNPRRLKLLFSIGCRDEYSALQLETFLQSVYQGRYVLGEWYDILNYIDIYKFKVLFGENYCSTYQRMSAYKRHVENEKPRFDNKGRRLYPNETQNADGRYRLTIVFNGKRINKYSWKLEPNDIVPVGKRDKKSIREIELDYGIYY